jgi:hypothetical protein
MTSRARSASSCNTISLTPPKICNDDPAKRSANTVAFMPFTSSADFKNLASSRDAQDRIETESDIVVYVPIGHLSTKLVSRHSDVATGPTQHTRSHKKSRQGVGSHTGRDAERLASLAVAEVVVVEQPALDPIDPPATPNPSARPARQPAFGRTRPVCEVYAARVP